MAAVVMKTTQMSVANCTNSTDRAGGNISLKCCGFQDNVIIVK